MSSGTALQTVNPGQQLTLTPEDLKILKNTKFKDFTDDEIAYSAKIAGQLALSPFLNQIHFVKRKNKDGTYSIAAQTGIDGFRLIAQRAGGYAGCDETVFEYGTGDTDQKRPMKAKVTVHRMVEGTRCAFTAEVRWNEFYSSVGGMWDRMPHVMLGKCAEAQALRKAFPAELSNLYAEEELHQAANPTKAQELQGRVIQTEVAKPASESEPDAKCPHCQSTNTMNSRYREGSKYCRDCKKEY